MSLSNSCSVFENDITLSFSYKITKKKKNLDKFVPNFSTATAAYNQSPQLKRVLHVVRLSFGSKQKLSIFFVCLFGFLRIWKVKSQHKNKYSGPSMYSHNWCWKNIYKSCSKSNASYFIMLSHDIRGELWWYGSRRWTFPSKFHYILLLCKRWMKRGRVTKQHSTWKCIWRKCI